MIAQEKSFSVVDLFRTMDSGAHWLLTTRIDVRVQFGQDLAVGLSSPNGVVDHRLPGQFLFTSSRSGWYFTTFPTRCMAGQWSTHFRQAEALLSMGPAMAAPIGPRSTSQNWGKSIAMFFLVAAEQGVPAAGASRESGRIPDHLTLVDTLTVALAGAPWQLSGGRASRIRCDLALWHRVALGGTRRHSQTPKAAAS